MSTRRCGCGCMNHSISKPGALSRDSLVQPRKPTPIAHPRKFAASSTRGYVQQKMLCNPIERISDGVPRLGVFRKQGLPCWMHTTDTQTPSSSEDRLLGVPIPVNVDISDHATHIGAGGPRISRSVARPSPELGLAMQHHLAN